MSDDIKVGLMVLIAFIVFVSAIWSGVLIMGSRDATLKTKCMELHGTWNYQQGMCDVK
jgi:hypothetical protein